MTDEGQRITVWLDKETHKTLKILAVREGVTMQDLNYKFIKDGLKAYKNE